MKTAFALIWAALKALIGLGAQKQSELDKQAGVNERVIAENQATTTAQAKIDRVPFDGDLDYKLHEHGF